MTALNQIENTLASLKDFQRETVKSVMQSFDSGQSQRVLVADEVGLGKTIVAKGVIAELLKTKITQQKNGLKSSPLRVTYICSNLTLAEENRKKLAIFHGDDQKKYVLEPTYSRLLETAVRNEDTQLSGKLLEVCSLTPSTSFNLTQGHGNKRERLIVYAALIMHPELDLYRIKLSNFFSDDVNYWTEDRRTFLKTECLDEEIVNDFLHLLGHKLSIKEAKYCGVYLQAATWIDVLLAFCKKEIMFKESSSRVRSCIRSLLARSCAKHLTADLFILDEFQRFRELLDTSEDTDQSLIAKQIFSNKKSKTLLLSATPFKAISQSTDDEEGNAHAEELKYLLNFISSSNHAMLDSYEAHRHELQQQILKLRDVASDINNLDDKHKKAIENLLAPYLCRTERAQISASYDNLFHSDVPAEFERIGDFSKAEIDVFKALDDLSFAIQEINQGRSASHIMEFYKASPWPLSFLNGYQFKKDLDKHRQVGAVKAALKRSEPAWLHQSSIQTYQLNLENAPHAKMRSLVRRVFKTSSEELLWVPPSMPHYPLKGSFERQEHFSKTLLFSSWALVPRALSGLLSYEAERRLLRNTRGVKKTYFKENKHRNSIRFDAKSTLVGWALVYPSKILRDMPMHMGNSTLPEIIRDRSTLLKPQLLLLKHLESQEHGHRSADKWYALAPMLLDKCAGADEYLEIWKDAQKKAIIKSEHKGIDAQFKSLCAQLLDDGNLSLGPMPDDLPEFLACLSVAGLGVSAARTLHTQYPDESELMIASAATKIAFALVAMFNKPESENVLKKRFPQQKYVQAIAKYSCDGDLQATLDEYVHMLKDAGVPFSNKNDRYSVSERLIDVLGFRTSSIACQFSEHKNKSEEHILENGSKVDNKHSLRCHYAVPLGNQKMTDEISLQRVSNVRDAFNSPFRPFVLNSTSIGQEGLDFHWYCSELVHWNLPANPIDIEQREGRINRYKSLVVRRRIAEGYKSDLDPMVRDFWAEIFSIADKKTKSQRSSDLVPYWHLPMGSAQIKRFVPMMPLSKDVAKFDKALKVLALYRLAFGQPRQEELLDNLLKRHFTEDEIAIITQKLVVNLSPMKLA